MFIFVLVRFFRLVLGFFGGGGVCVGGGGGRGGGGGVED